MKPYEKLKSIRIKKGLTTYQLSELTGIPQSTISKMENGKRKIEADSIQLLAKALNVPTSAFFDSENLISENNSTTKENIIDEDIRRIERARSKMKLEDKEKMMRILELSFEEYFDDED